MDRNKLLTHYSFKNEMFAMLCIFAFMLMSVCLCVLFGGGRLQEQRADMKGLEYEHDVGG